MRTQLNLLTDRILFPEACEPPFRDCAFVVDTKPASSPVAASLDTCADDGASLTRCSRSAQGTQAALLPPPRPTQNVPAMLFHVATRAPHLSPKELTTLSLNFGVLDRVPKYFDVILQGDKLRHPVEYIGHLTNTALESLILELRTLNMEYVSGLYAEERTMFINDDDISGFVRQGQRIIGQEVNRTATYFHEVSRIALALRRFYAVTEMPHENDARSKTLLRTLCRTMRAAMSQLQDGMHIFERRLRDVASCNAALKLGACDTRPTSKPPTPMPLEARSALLETVFTLPNVMRPTQVLQVITFKQVRALTKFFSDYSGIIGKQYEDWAMLRGNLADLVVVIQDPSKREGRWEAETTMLSPAVVPFDMPDDVLSLEDDASLEAIARLSLSTMPNTTAYSVDDEPPADLLYAPT